MDQLHLKVTQAKALGHSYVEASDMVMAALFGIDYDKPYAFMQGVLVCRIGKGEAVVEQLGTDGQELPTENIRMLHRSKK